MTKHRLFIMNDGTYLESAVLDTGPLIYRSDEGSRKRQRNNSIIMTINTQLAFFFLVVFVLALIEERRLVILWILLIPGALFAWIFLDWKQYRIVRPVTEIYGKGILLKKVGWPRQDTLFWPYNELESIVLERKTVKLKSKNGKGKASFPLYEVGDVGITIIEKRLQGISPSEEQKPRLVLYGP